MISVSTEQEVGKKHSLGTLEIIEPLDQLVYFVCVEILKKKKKRGRGCVNWSNLHLCS